jgi:hypothetical protein
MTPEELQAAMEAALKQASAQPTRRPIRAALQGASMGFSDEAEALARSVMGGSPYDAELAQSRGKLEQYRKDYPLESMAAEFAGGVGMGIATGGLGAGGSAATLGRMAAQGAAQGALTGFGASEGGLENRLTGAAIGGAGGAALAPVAGVVMKGLGAAVSATANAMFGLKGATAVQNELQRMAAESGMTVDEIVDGIARGTIMAENSTLKNAVRALYIKGGLGSKIISDAMTQRPAQTRTAAMDEMRSYLSGGTGTARAQQAALLEQQRAARKAGYAQFENAPAPQQVIQELEQALQRAPQAAATIDAAMQARGMPALTQRAANGAVALSRQPTVSEAELIRRAVEGNVQSLYRDPMSAVTAEALKDVEGGLRSSLDTSIPALAAVRSDVAAQEAAKRAFAAGEKALSGDANQVVLDIEKIVSDPNQLDAFKTGFLATIERRALTGQRDSMIAKLADVDGRGTAENMILRSIMSPDEIDALLQSLAVASKSSTASKYILGQSATAGTQSAEARLGSGIGMADVADAAMGSPAAMLAVATKLVASAGVDLTDAQSASIARVLVSENPELVRAALTDVSGAARLADIIKRAASRLNSGVQGGVGSASGLLGSALAAPRGDGLTLQFNTPNDLK